MVQVGMVREEIKTSVKMVWAKLKNNEIIETREACPRNTNIVSNFYLLSENEKKQHGWYQVKNNNTQIKSWQKVTNKILTYNSTEDIVEETSTIEDLSLAEFKDFKYSQLRNDAKKYIFSQYPDYKQLSALAGFYSENENTEIKTGVKSLFDVAIQMKTDLYNATTYEEVDAVYFRKDLNDNPLNPNWVLWGEE